MAYTDKYLFTFCFLLVICGIVDSELVGVLQLNRHGARTGVDKLNLTSKIFFKIGEQNLTPNGYKQHEILGQWIAERYIHYDYNLLNKDFDKDEIIILSSPVQRTIFSAAAFVKGLYPQSEVIYKYEPYCVKEKCLNIIENDVPPINNLKLKSDYSKINISILDPNNDKIFHSTECKLSEDSQHKLRDLLVKTNIYEFSDSEITQSVDDIKSKWPEPFKSLSPEENIYSKQFLLKLLKFIKPTQYHFDNKFFKFNENTNNLLQKLSAENWYTGRLIETPAFKLLSSAIFDSFLSNLDLIEKRKETKSKLKYVVYSGHDTNIIEIFAKLFDKDKLLEMLNNLDKYDNIIQPKFAASLLIELHSSDKHSPFLSGKDQHFIRLIYNGDILRDGLHYDLQYDANIDGINYDHFKDFLKSRIDYSYKYLNCHR